MKKIILSEQIYEAIQQNKALTDSGFSKVYIGKNHVKKIKNLQSLHTRNKNTIGYDELEIKQFELMQKYYHTGIFPKTIIKNVKDVMPVIVQEKIDVHGQVAIYHAVERAYTIHADYYLSFGWFLNSIMENGLMGERQNVYKRVKDKLDGQLRQAFERYVQIAVISHDIYEKEDLVTNYGADLNKPENFGIKNGKILVLDFIYQG